MSGKRVLIPYVLFAFVLGFAWFMLAPLVPDIGKELHVPIPSVLLFVSLYGYAMVLGSIPAGLWTAKRGPGPVLVLAVILSVVGLFFRSFAHTYTLFFIAQAISALAYPFLIAPVGAVLRMSQIKRLKAATGLTIGLLFFGMGLSALIAAHLGLHVGLWLGFILNLIVGTWLLFSLKQMPAPVGQTSVRIRLTYSNWWIVGLVVSSTSVMIGGITSSALGHLHVQDAESLGGLLSGLTFLGSAAGAALFGAIGERVHNTKALISVLAILTWLSVLMITLMLTGHLASSSGLFSVIFFLAGFFGNGWYTLTLDEAARRAADNGSAGLNTAGYSMASNIGVAIIPVVLGPLVLSQPTVWIVLTMIIGLIALLVAFVTPVRGEKRV